MTEDPRIGTRIAGYRIIAYLARGGMSVIYLAEDERLGRRVALKLLPPELVGDEHARTRFLREFRMAAALDHPNIVPVHDADESDGTLYIAMRWVETGDLGRLIKSMTVMPAMRAMIIVGQVAGALDVAHSAGLVHRDIKPGNILVDTGAGVGGADHAYLTDFGLTRAGTASMNVTSTGIFVGTTQYASPEQIRGEHVNGRADQYSLACVLFACLTGRPPFHRGTEAASLLAHLNDEPASLGAHELNRVLSRALAKQPVDRFDTCTAFVEAAALAAQGAPELIQAVSELRSTGGDPHKTRRGSPRSSDEAISQPWPSRPAAWLLWPVAWPMVRARRDGSRRASRTTGVAVLAVLILAIVAGWPARASSVADLHWKRLPLPPLPETHGQIIVANESTLAVLGGWDSSGAQASYGALLDLKTSRWRRVRNCTCNGNSEVFITERYVLALAGGIERMDLETGTWDYIDVAEELRRSGVELIPDSAEGLDAAFGEAATIWTGSKLLLFGRRSAAGNWVPDGVLVTPEGSVTYIEKAPLQPRTNAHAVWTGQELIVAGGGDRFPEPTKLFVDAAVYRPGRGWRKVRGDMPFAFSAASGAFWTGRSMILVGERPESQGTEMIEFDPERDRWSGLPALDEDVDQSIVWTGRQVMALPSGRVLGGEDGAWRRTRQPSFGPAPRIVRVGTRLFLWDQRKSDRGFVASLEPTGLDGFQRAARAGSVLAIAGVVLLWLATAQRPDRSVLLVVALLETLAVFGGFSVFLQIGTDSNATITIASTNRPMLRTPVSASPSPTTTWTRQGIAGIRGTPIFDLTLPSDWLKWHSSADTNNEYGAPYIQYEGPTGEYVRFLLLTPDVPLRTRTGGEWLVTIESKRLSIINATYCDVECVDSPSIFAIAETRGGHVLSFTGYRLRLEFGIAQRGVRFNPNVFQEILSSVRFETAPIIER